MLDKLMGGLIDKEKITRETITDTLQELKTELECEQTDLFIMIKPFNDEGEFKCYVYQNKEKVNGNGKVPMLIREITLKEIIGG